MIPALVGVNVLLVEDDLFHQVLVKNLLNNAGVQISISNNGVQALQAINAERFSAVLMDIQMPVMDGLETTRLMRKEFSYEELPIIAMTANAGEDQQQQYLAVGMNECIPKPIHFQSLYDILIRTTHHKFQANAQENFSFENPSEKNVGFRPEVSIERVGSKEVFLYMLDKFIPNYEQSVKKILNAVTSNNLEEAKRVTHSLKGAAATIGTPLLFESARQLELALTAHESWKYLTLIERLRKELYRAVNAIDIYLNADTI